MTDINNRMKFLSKRFRKPTAKKATRPVKSKTKTTLGLSGVTIKKKNKSVDVGPNGLSFKVRF
jgi:hypothetical protein